MSLVYQAGCEQIYSKQKDPQTFSCSEFIVNLSATHLCVESTSCLEKEGEICLYFTSVGVGSVFSLTL